MVLIPVIYADKKTGFVLPVNLDKLIMKNLIVAFRRQEGWVFIEEGPIRISGGTDDYIGPERRRQFGSFQDVSLMLIDNVRGDGFDIEGLSTSVYPFTWNGNQAS